MGIAEKHAYRFGFLKSDQWESIRLKALVRDGGRCQVCYTQSPFNDVHHHRYRKCWRDTKITDLVTLCRQCHELVHWLMKNHPELSGWEAVLWAKDIHIERKQFKKQCRYAALGHNGWVAWNRKMLFDAISDLKNCLTELQTGSIYQPAATDRS